METRIFICGTKAVAATLDGRWRVVCATCGYGMSYFTNKQQAIDACTKRSGEACRKCGAS